MLKNGRPYTDENGHVDDALVTGHDYDEVKKLARWVKDNIVKARGISGHTSYSLKHILQRETGVYLTNNEFKDLLLLMGFRPVKYTDLNWRYRIMLKSELNDNPSPFFKFAAREYARSDTPEGDFARDMMGDRDFPMLADDGIIREYLARRHVDVEVVNAFEAVWAAYVNEK